MIQELISDLVYERISLATALTRAKLIAFKIHNESFKTWITRELEGYNSNDELPKYRQVKAQMFLKVHYPNGQVIDLTFTHSKADNPLLKEILSTKYISESISILETMLSNAKDSIIKLQVPYELVHHISESLVDNAKLKRGIINSGYFEVARSHFQSVVELTKQRLLDTLMQLNDEFPNLENEFKVTPENNRKADQIITNNIYGSNNLTNTAAGNNIQQTVSDIKFGEEEEKALLAYGVEQDEIAQLKETLGATKKDDPTFGQKVNKWLSGVTAAMVGRGAYEHIPDLVSYIGGFL